MKLDDRRRHEKERYRILKEEKEGEIEPDGSRVFYLISGKWVE
jgi:hypothetical protein